MMEWCTRKILVHPHSSSFNQWNCLIRTNPGRLSRKSPSDRLLAPAGLMMCAHDPISHAKFSVQTFRYVRWRGGILVIVVLTLCCVLLVSQERSDDEEIG